MSYWYSKTKIQGFADTIWYKEVKLSSTKSSGPGGQHVNKNETKIQLAWSVIATNTIPEPYKQRFIEMHAQYITDDGIVRIDASVHRSQDANKELVRKKLKDMISTAFKPPKAPRKMTNPPRHVVDARIAQKKRRSKIRQSRSIIKL